MRDTCRIVLKKIKESLFKIKQWLHVENHKSTTFCVFSLPGEGNRVQWNRSCSASLKLQANKLLNQGKNQIWLFLRLIFPLEQYNLIEWRPQPLLTYTNMAIPHCAHRRQLLPASLKLRAPEYVIYFSSISSVGVKVFQMVW